MNADIFAEWYRLQGHQVIKTKSSFWTDHAPFALQAFPFHLLIDPSENELNELLIRNHFLTLRYSTDFNNSVGKVSYHAILDDKEYNERKLSKWSRKNVRRGLKKCQVEPIPFERLFDEGWLMQIDTLKRQGRHVKINKRAWEKKWSIAKSLPGFEAWGAIVGNNLAASVVTFNMDGCVYMLYQQCFSRYLHDHVNNALSFVVSQTMIQRSEVNSILYGLHSLDARPGIDEFKFRMGYKPKPVKQRVIFHPYLTNFDNPLSLFLVKKLTLLMPGNEFISKVEGMLRFAWEGKQSLEKQSIPAVLLTKDGSGPHAWTGEPKSMQALQKK